MVLHAKTRCGPPCTTWRYAYRKAKELLSQLVILGFYRGKIGIMENKMETTVMGYIGVILWLYRGYIGIMENKMETTKEGMHQP